MGCPTCVPPPTLQSQGERTCVATCAAVARWVCAEAEVGKKSLLICAKGPHDGPEGFFIPGEPAQLDAPRDGIVLAAPSYMSRGCLGAGNAPLGR